MNKIICGIVLFLCVSCGMSGKVELSFVEPQTKTKYTDDKPVAVKLDASGSLDSISLLLNNEGQIKLHNNSAEITQNNLLLGENILVAEAYKNGKSVAKKYLLFDVQTTYSPKIWKAKILRKLQHETDAFTQGLSFYNGKLYETTGENGHSRLVVRDLQTGKILQSEKIADRYFGEGSTILDDKVYYITWTSGEGFIFDANTLKRTDSFQYGKYSPQGWGLTVAGNQLVLSNGSEKLLFFNPKTMQVEKTISVISSKGKHTNLNELEYDGTYIYANVWMTQEILAINPHSGRVEGILDCRNLVDLEENAQFNPDSDVLNGIAYNPNTKTFYLTGKNWEHIYEVKVVKQ